MNLLMFLATLATAGVVIVRCVCVAARMNRRDWHGHSFGFSGLSAGCALSASGALGMVLGYPHAPLLLLMGVAFGILFERFKT